MSTQNKTPPKKLAYQELHNAGWSFIFLPKYDTILGIKININFAGVQVDSDGKPTRNPQNNELNLTVNTGATLQIFTKDEYKEQMELTGKPNV